MDKNYVNGKAKTTQAEFVKVCLACDCIVKDVSDFFKKDGISLSNGSISKRIKTLRKRGILPLDSGNKVSKGEVLRGTSTLYGDDNKIKLQWVKTNVALEKQLDSFKEAVDGLALELNNGYTSIPFKNQTQDNMLTTYIINDVHFGALMWKEETGDRDWDLGKARRALSSASDYLLSNSTSSKECLIVDLGDLTEIDDFSNSTPKSGHTLSVDGRYPKVLKTAYMAIIDLITKALKKHEIVHFINIAGNHDMSTGHAIREIISAWFRNEPRVKVNTSPSKIKYFTFGDTLMQFAHGDEMKMAQAGEVMAFDMRKEFAMSNHRFSHFGHNHKDSVIDTRLCRVESHRNLAPLNDWAAGKGYRRGAGTMKSITYGKVNGELSRTTYSISG